MHGKGTLVYTYGDKFVGDWVDVGTLLVAVLHQWFNRCSARPRKKVRVNSSTLMAIGSKAGVCGVHAALPVTMGRVLCT